MSADGVGSQYESSTSVKHPPLESRKGFESKRYSVVCKALETLSFFWPEKLVIIPSEPED